MHINLNKDILMFAYDKLLFARKKVRIILNKNMNDRRKFIHTEHHWVQLDFNLIIMIIIHGYVNIVTLVHLKYGVEISHVFFDAVDSLVSFENYSRNL